ncbi:uncharacterized protein VTP21DRAFT_8353 [Calcarisporiella thermophila]|uniref:uncharacterized protein n=1 Tax=Calcarisporiella thermophila TaxID=911321 RepID=UPI003741F4A0
MHTPYFHCHLPMLVFVFVLLSLLFCCNALNSQPRNIIDASARPADPSAQIKFSTDTRKDLIKRGDIGPALRTTEIRNNRYLRSTDIVLLSTLDGALHAVHRGSGVVLWTVPSQTGPMVSMSVSMSCPNPNPSYSSGKPLNESKPNEDHEWHPPEENSLSTIGMDEEEDREWSDRDISYLVEPVGEGNLYARDSSGNIQKFPLTIKQLLGMPSRFDDGKVCVGSLKTTHYTIHPRTGEILQSYSNDFIMEHEKLHDSLPHDAIFIGRNEYKLLIVDGRLKPECSPLLNLSYSMYSPNFDMGYASQLYPGDIHIFQMWKKAYAVNLSNGIPVWHVEFDSPVIQVFNVYATSEHSPRLIVTRQPPVSSSDIRGETPTSKLLREELERNTRGIHLHVENFGGTSIARSTEHFPFVNIDKPPNSLSASPLKVKLLPAPGDEETGESPLEVDKDEKRLPVSPSTSGSWLDELGRFWKTVALLLAGLGWTFRRLIQHAWCKTIENNGVLRTWLKWAVSPQEESQQGLQHQGAEADEVEAHSENEKKDEGKRRKKGKKLKNHKETSPKNTHPPQPSGPTGDPVSPDLAHQGVEQKETSRESNAPRPMTTTSSNGFPLKFNSLTVSDTILGYGSQGTVVFKGMFEGREVAVKRLLLDFYDIAHQEVMLLQESDDHPNVIRYYCKEQCDRFLYIALELCPASLYDLVERSNSEAMAELLATTSPPKILHQIISGLHHLHKLKIVHRDIKPQNILISTPRKGARVLISDFGLCKRLDADQSSFHNTTLHPGGTIGWRAPELLKNERGAAGEALARGDGIEEWEWVGEREQLRITKAVDIFSAGCVFYYVLSGGEHPFGDRFSREANILRNQYSLERLEGMGEEGIEACDLIRRMLAPNPADRPDTAEVLRHPFFWTPMQRLAFLQDVSDRLEVEERDPPSPLLEALERNAREVVGPDWHRRVDRVLVEDLQRYRRYDRGRIQDLLRAMRNKKHHYQDLGESAKRILGPLPDGFLTYFNTRFPRLFLHVYYLVAESELRDEVMFRHYFDIS